MLHCSHLHTTLHNYSPLATEYRQYFPGHQYIFLGDYLTSSFHGECLFPRISLVFVSSSLPCDCFLIFPWGLFPHLSLGIVSLSFLGDCFLVFPWRLFPHLSLVIVSSSFHGDCFSYFPGDCFLIFPW